MARKGAMSSTATPGGAAILTMPSIAASTLHALEFADPSGRFARGRQGERAAAVGAALAAAFEQGGARARLQVRDAATDRYLTDPERPRSRQKLPVSATVSTARRSRYESSIDGWKHPGVEFQTTGGWRVWRTITCRSVSCLPHSTTRSV